MTIYGLKFLKGDKSLNGKVEYPLNQWVEVPGNGAYVAHSSGLWSSGILGDTFALFACENEFHPWPPPPCGVRCWKRVRRTALVKSLFDPILDACAAEDPWLALVTAASLLSAERLDACAAELPWTALEFAAPLLSSERLDACAAESPWAALAFAAALLSAERRDYCAAKCPEAALAFAESLLSAERRDDCKRRE